MPLTGILTIKVAGVIEVFLNVCTYQTLNNRHELHVELHHDSGSGYSLVSSNANYASRNNAVDKGSTGICGHKILCGVGDKIKCKMFHIGVAASAGAPQVSGMTTLSVNHYS